VLAPTRELARQTETVLLALGDYMKVNVFLVVGGEKVRDMMAVLNSGVHVVVGKDPILNTCAHNRCTLINSVNNKIFQPANDNIDQGMIQFPVEVYNF